MAFDLAYYPPSPTNVPRSLTAPTPRYRLQVVLVLISLLLFVLFYVALVILSGYLVFWSVTYNMGVVNKVTILLKLGLIGCSVMLFLFLLKGLFKRQRMDDSLRVEIKEKEHPALFAFIRQLCAETRAPFPRHVYLSPEVNAAVFYHSSFLSLFLPTRKNLLIGLGLVNVVPLSEFKAVLAHEFGHFSQSSMKVGTYVYTSNRIIADMVYGRDWLDDLIAQAQQSDYRVAIFAWFFTGIVWLLRKILEGVFRAINVLNSALSRQMEFNADLVAVSVTGSDAIACSLARLEFANEALMQAWNDLQTAAHHHLYTRDLFYHQKTGAEFLRRQRKDPKLGEPPPLPDDPAQTVQVFQPGDSGIPLMWKTHPSNFDREQNAKRNYIRGVSDERSPWILFGDPQGVREQITRHFYRTVLNVDDQVPLEAPEKLQSFIDDEHAETTYHERYQGMYDDRYLEPGDLTAAVGIVRASQREAKLLAQLHADLYGDELKMRMETYKKRLGEGYLLSGLENGELRLTGRSFEFRGQHYEQAEAKGLLEMVSKEVEADQQWLAARDREIFRVHYLMACDLGQDTARELHDRYHFHAELQNILSSLNAHHSRLQFWLNYLSQQRQLPSEVFQEAMKAFCDAHSNLEAQLTAAGKLRIPELKNVTPGQILGPFLLDKPLIYALSGAEQSLNGEWIGRFLGQFGEVRDKVRRIHYKSLGGILALQEKIAKDWSVQQASVADVVPVEQSSGV